MARAILTQDLLAMCLLACKGDLNTSLADIISVLEEFQEKYNRHFGLSRDDLRTLFLLEFGLKKSCCLDFGKDIVQNMLEQLHEIKLKEAGRQIIHYYDTYFNDEGGGFSTEGEMTGVDSHAIYSWYGYDPAEYAGKVKVKAAMKEFFQKDKDYDPQLVMDFLRKHGIGQDLLFHCSRPGESS